MSVPKWRVEKKVTDGQSLCSSVSALSFCCNGVGESVKDQDECCCRSQVVQMPGPTCKPWSVGGGADRSSVRQS